MLEPTSTLTTTITQAGTFSLDANWALVALTFVLICITGYYAFETRLSRKTAQDTLDELKKQHLQEVEQHEKDRALTIQYVEETQKSRVISEQELDALKQQHFDQYNAFVMPYFINSNPDSEGRILLKLVNLGPGPAKSIAVRANHWDGSTWHLWEAKRSGLVVGGTGDLYLTPCTGDLWDGLESRAVNVEIRVIPTLGEERIERMPLAWGHTGSV